MDKKRLPIGRDNLKDIIDRDLYYVDKTNAIEKLLKNKEQICIFSRPRQFGKSMFISMLDNFFNIEYKEANKYLFKDLNISKSKYYNELSSRPVIKLNFRRLSSINYDDFYGSYKELIRELFSDKRYLMDKLDEDEKKVFNNFLYAIASLDEYKNAINIISSYLHKYYNNKVIILIDEYDIPLREGYLSGFYNDTLNFLKEIFLNTFKNNNYIDMTIMIGVLRVSKESLFSDLNNVEIYGVVDKDYNEYFGFTESETKELLEYYDLQLNDEVKNMYDGYNFNGVTIYNPWSISNYACDKRLIPYSHHSSKSELTLEKIINKSNDNINVLIEKLIQKEKINANYDKETFMLKEYNTFDEIATFCINNGYLTFDNELSKVMIPNEEIRMLFIKIMFDKFLNSQHFYLQDLLDFTESLVANNKEQIEKYLTKIIRCIDLVDNANTYFKDYILIMFYMFINNKYILKSNREAGSGRFDIMIESVDRKLGIIIELKISKHNNLEKVAKNALKQIEEKEYYKELLLDKIEHIDKYVIIFKGKKCIVR